MAKYGSILETVGNTPVVRINKLAPAHVNLFVNSANVRDREGLDTPLAPGDVLTIVPAVSGG